MFLIVSAQIDPRFLKARVASLFFFQEMFGLVVKIIFWIIIFFCSNLLSFRWLFEPRRSQQITQLRKKFFFCNYMSESQIDEGYKPSHNSLHLTRAKISVQSKVGQMLSVEVWSLLVIETINSSHVDDENEDDRWRSWWCCPFLYCPNQERHLRHILQMMVHGDWNNSSESMPYLDHLSRLNFKYLRLPGSFCLVFFSFLQAFAWFYPLFLNRLWYLNILPITFG